MDRIGGDVRNKVLHQVLVDVIAQSEQDRIPFSQFMELALYHPSQGYYMQERSKLGRSGDFFTNAHVGSVFGQVLSRYFQSLAPQGEPWTLIEFGAGDGRIAEQICQGFIETGVDSSRVHLYVIEKSPYHRKLQKSRLSAYPFEISWVSQLAEVPVAAFSIIYSNELLDAFPVHRVRKMECKGLQEMCIAVNQDTGQLIEVWDQLSNPEIEMFVSRFGSELKNGASIEVNLLARAWLEEIAQWMINGYILTIDYGARMNELSSREKGTFRCFYQHTIPQDPYMYLGEIDMTCHVNFESLEEWGREWGLNPIFLSTQSQFLLQSGILDMLSSDVSREDPFSAEGKKRRAIQQLIHPDGMGDAFKVLLQRKQG